ncbi:MAG: SapC family protein [Candidatus Accumulibacter sp.]|uniref:SapC family protein n=1 Tax=Candidatus Accumulibacter affinis TaxID=2954384 RepID=A0A935TC89_9PROT|nr:SapC family protein [Candidatus Accumulibacter affinis]
MAKQLLIYETAVPVSAARHRGVSLEASGSYAFSAGINAVPLMAIEFPRAVAEYAIVFSAESEEVMPVVVLGIRNEQNLYLSSDARWKADYIPGFIRRYPFVFSSSADGQSLTLCIDESHPGVNREGRGNALFGDDGKPTPYVDQVLDFLKDYQAHFERTRAFGRRIHELGLLEPMQANVTTPQGEKLTLGGFLVVSRDKLRELAGETLQQLVKTDELELLYLHLASMRNFNEVKDRLIDSIADTPGATESQDRQLDGT